MTDSSRIIAAATDFTQIAADLRTDLASAKLSVALYAIDPRTKLAEWAEEQARICMSSVTKKADEVRA